MTHCIERQREDDAIDHHLAATELFRREQCWHRLATWLPIGIAVIAPIAAVASPWDGIGPLLAAVAGASALSARLFAKPAAARNHLAGVAELEARDCHIFGLSWNEEFGRRPRAEATIQLAKATRRRRPDEAGRAEHWYPFEDQTAPDDKLILIAQRSNLAWGENDHERWASNLLGALIAIFVLGGSAAIIAGVSLLEYLGLVAFPSVPGLSEIWDLYSAHRQAAENKRVSRERLDDLLQDGALDQARAVQNEIYQSRAGNPRVPNWLYESEREENDEAMRAAAKKLAS